MVDGGFFKIKGGSNTTKAADVAVAEVSAGIVDIPRSTVVVAVDTAESASPHTVVGVVGVVDNFASDIFMIFKLLT